MRHKDAVGWSTDMNSQQLQQQQKDKQHQLLKGGVAAAADIPQTTPYGIALDVLTIKPADYQLNQVNDELKDVASSKGESDAGSEEPFEEDEEQENYEEYDQEQEVSEAESEESNDSAPAFNQIRHLLKQNQAAKVVSETNGSDTNSQHNRGEKGKIGAWMSQVDKLNRRMQAQAVHLTREAEYSNPGTSYTLNSYAYRSRELINTLLSYLPIGFDKSKVEQIFIEAVSSESHQFQFDQILLLESTEKIRKRALISSTFATAYRTKHAINIFSELRNCRANAHQLFKRSYMNPSNRKSHQDPAPAQMASVSTSIPLLKSTAVTIDKSLPLPVNMPIQQRHFRKDLEMTIANLVSKYETAPLMDKKTPAKRGLIQLPTMPQPVKKPNMPLDPDDFSDDETYYKQRAIVLKYKAWRYSLYCPKNIVQDPIPKDVAESPRKESPGKVSRQGGARSNIQAAQELHGRSPNLTSFKRTIINRMHLQQQAEMPMQITAEGSRPHDLHHAQTMSPSNNRQQLMANTCPSGMPAQHLQKKLEYCPIHPIQNRGSIPLQQQQRLNSIDLGGVIMDAANPMLEPTESAELLLYQFEQHNLAQDGAMIESAAMHSKAKSSFAQQRHQKNPFKQDNKKATATKQMMTINGRIRNQNGGKNAASANQTKQNIQYDPKIVAHMAKMYMVHNHTQPNGVTVSDRKKSLFPQHVQQQMLLNSAAGAHNDPAQVYDRTMMSNGANDAQIQGAMEDLIKRKFMQQQAPNAQNFYSQIYNADVQINCMEQDQRQNEHDRDSRLSQQAPGSQMNVNSALCQYPHPQTIRTTGSACAGAPNLAARQAREPSAPQLPTSQQPNFFQRELQRSSKQPTSRQPLS